MSLLAAPKGRTVARTTVTKEVEAKPATTVAAVGAAAIAFARAAFERTTPAFDETLTPGAGTQAFGGGELLIPARGFARYLWILVEAAAGAGVAAVKHPDAPWSVFHTLQFNDVESNAIYGPLQGFEAYLAQKYGGYSFVTDPKQSPAFSDVATSGNFTFLLRVPLEVSPRDGMGALANLNAGQRFSVNAVLAALGAIYTTNPTTVPNIRVRGWLDSWTQPDPVDELGNAQNTRPPYEGTTQFWKRRTYDVTAGFRTVELGGMGHYIRNLVCVWRDNTGARSTAGFPDPVQLSLDGYVLDNVGRALLRHRMAEHTGFTAAENAAGGLDAGVFVWDFCHDLDGKIGYEERDGYLPTTPASELTIAGTFATDGVLTVLTNDVAPAAGGMAAPLPG